MYVNQPVSFRPPPQVQLRKVHSELTEKTNSRRPQGLRKGQERDSRPRLPGREGGRGLRPEGRRQGRLCRKYSILRFLLPAPRPSSPQPLILTKVETDEPSNPLHRSPSRRPSCQRPRPMPRPTRRRRRPPLSRRLTSSTRRWRRAPPRQSRASRAGSVASRRKQSMVVWSWWYDGTCNDESISRRF